MIGPLRFLALTPFALTLAACGQQPEGEPVQRIDLASGKSVMRPSATPGMASAQPSTTPAASKSAACASETFEGVAITHCIADPGTMTVHTTLGSPPYRSFAKLKEALGTEAKDVVFAMNAGMFDDAGKPIGYFVQNGNRLRELDRASGSGNFYLKPNGVFYGGVGQWHVRTADSFYANVSDRPQFGTQSGPMLLIDGKIHPQITENGPSRQIRNGVGVDAQGRAHFAISEAPLSFGSFARYFRDVAKTPDALYLDGNVSGLWDPSTGRMDSRAPIGPMIVVERKE